MSFDIEELYESEIKKHFFEAKDQLESIKTYEDIEKCGFSLENCKKAVK